MTIPTQCINPAIAKFLSTPYVPTPNAPGLRANFRRTLLAPTTFDQTAGLKQLYRKGDLSPDVVLASYYAAAREGVVYDA